MYHADQSPSVLVTTISVPGPLFVCGVLYSQAHIVLCSTESASRGPFSPDSSHCPLGGALYKVGRGLSFDGTDSETVGSTLRKRRHGKRFDMRRSLDLAIQYRRKISTIGEVRSLIGSFREVKLGLFKK